MCLWCSYANIIIVYLRQITVLFLCMIRYSYNYVCNDCRETTIDLEYVILKSYNSYLPAFSCGVAIWDRLTAPSAGPTPPADVEGGFCCFIVFCRDATLHVHEIKNKEQVSPF